MGPTLSKLEQERIAEAVKLHNSGAKIRWRNIGRRISYVTPDGRDHQVLSSINDEVHEKLRKQVQDAVKAGSRV